VIGKGRKVARAVQAAKSAGRHWEHFSHIADIGLRGIGPTREAAFEEAATALTAVISEPSRVAAREAVHLACVAPDDEMLLVEWLNALVFEMASRNMLFRRFSVRIDGGKLSGTAWGEPVDVARHRPAVEVKGATYTALRVRQGEDGLWTAECVVDV
jgi:SHS2 domain-containing protein